MTAMFVVVLRYTGSAEEVAALVPAHLAWLERHTASGVFVASGRQDPPVGSVILARGVTRAELEGIVAADPFLAAATAEVIEFAPHPGRLAPELAALLAP